MLHPTGENENLIDPNAGAVNGQSELVYPEIRVKI